MFQGNNVKDEATPSAAFQELSSCPATMSAGKTADAYGLIQGNAIEVAEAEQAYIPASSVSFGGRRSSRESPSHTSPSSGAAARGTPQQPRELRTSPCRTV